MVSPSPSSFGPPTTVTLPLETIGTRKDSLELDENFKIEHTLLLVKPHAAAEIGEIRYILQQKGFNILCERAVKFYTGSAMQFADIAYTGALINPKGDERNVAAADDSSNADESKSATDKSNDDVFLGQKAFSLVNGGDFAVAFHLLKVNAIRALSDLCGLEDPDLARRVNVSTLRARFGLNVDFNAVHCSRDAVSAINEIKFFFPRFRAGSKVMHRVEKYETYMDYFNRNLKQSLQATLVDVARNKPARDIMALLPQILRKHNTYQPPAAAGGGIAVLPTAAVAKQ